MNRILRSGRSFATFDDESGSVTDLDSTSEPATGLVIRVGGKCVALYADEGELVLQLERDRFPVSSSKLTYLHNWDDGTTTFGASCANKEAAVTYPAWWAEAGVDQWEVRAVPERDEEEDNLAWIARRLMEDPSEQRRVLIDWHS